MALAHRERVLRAATTSFLAHGYGSSVEGIARRAGVAKQTVYHHFPTKDALFREVARDLARSVLVELEAAPQDLRGTLVRFATVYRRRSLSARSIAAFRTLVPEVPRFRGLARAMYAVSMGETERRLAEYLRQAMDEGKLRKDDAAFAAELLLGMLLGHDRVKRLFGVPCEGESDARRAARVVDNFLKAYSA